MMSFNNQKSSSQDHSLHSRKHPAHMPLYEISNRTKIVYLTVCSKNRKSILAFQDVHELIWKAWAKADQWVVGRYIIMPDHIHLFCSPAASPHKSIRVWMKYWKALASRAWPRPEEHPVWQQDGWDKQLRSRDSYSAKWDYVRNNPVRGGLVTQAEQWPYQGEMARLAWHD